MRFILRILALVAVVFLASCGGKGRTGNASSASSTEQSEAPRTFPQPPQAPSILSSPQERGEYIATHFWDAFLDKPYHCDSTHVNGVLADEVESAVGRYVTILEKTCEPRQAKKAVEGFFKQISEFQETNPTSNVFGFLEKMVSRYLYDPNSPVRDEDLYLPFVKGLASSPLVSEDMKPAYSRDAEMCSINQVGTPAADILFTDRNGRRHTLYGVRAERTLLLFSNPGCPACEEIIGTLRSNQRVLDLEKSGRLAVVNLYIDLELDKWKAYAADYPKTWLNGYDQDYAIRENLTYCVRAIPSLYLLDEEKKVMLKDAPIERVLPYLENI